MTTFIRDSYRADVRNLLDHASAIFESYRDLDKNRAESAVDTFSVAAAQAQKESSRYLEPYRLAIVGDFKVGKSSLINALLGQKNLVAEGVAPTTGAVTELQWAEFPAGVVMDGGDQVLFEGDLETAARYADQRTPEGMKSAGKGVRVILKQPSDVLRQLTIIDTPGLGASELDDRVTLNSLHIADAAILVLACGKAGGDGPIQMAERLRTANKRVTLVLSRADLDASRGATCAAEMSEVFSGVIDGPPVIFSSKEVQKALEKAAESAEMRDEALADSARADLESWGFVELTERILHGHLSSTGSAGVARARAALGELRKRCRALSISSAREHDAAENLVESLTKELDETERVVAEVLDPKVPYLEDRIEDVVDQYVGRLLDTLREAVEVFVDERMDSGVTEGIRAFWGWIDSDFEAQRRKELDRSFKKLFPPEVIEITAQEIERAVNRLLLAEWKAAVKEVGARSIAAGLDVEDLMKKVDEHLGKVLASIAADVAAAIALFFVPGGWIRNVIQLAGTAALTQSQLSKADARVALIKRNAGLQIRNQRVTIRSKLAASYRELNEKVHNLVVAKTRGSSSQQAALRDTASTLRGRWRDAARDLAGILEAVADIEQGGLR